MINSGRGADERTGLVLLTPDLDELVQPWRRRYDPVVAYGMPAHVTILYPWLPFSAITADDRAVLAELCAASSPVEMTFGRFGRFPETLWLDPQPVSPIRELIERIAAKWPDYPPFEGAFAEIVPHLTVADRRDPDALGHVIADVGPRLPVRLTVPALTLMRLIGGRWQAAGEFAFAAAAHQPTARAITE